MVIAMTIMIRGETTIQKWRVTFQRPPTYGTCIARASPSIMNSTCNMKRAMQRNPPTLLLIAAEELGLEVHEELYGGGTPPDDQTCLGSFRSSPDIPKK